MQLKDILAKEQSRESDVDYRTLYLVPEGSFYRAYEWSAWLCYRYVSQFKVTHRLLKNSDAREIAMFAVCRTTQEASIALFI